MNHVVAEPAALAPGNPVTNKLPVLKAYAVTGSAGTDMNFTVAAAGAGVDFFVDTSYKWPSFLNYRYVRHIPAESAQSVIVPVTGSGPLFVSFRPVSSAGTATVSVAPVTAACTLLRCYCRSCCCVDIVAAPLLLLVCHPRERILLISVRPCVCSNARHRIVARHGDTGLGRLRLPHIRGPRWGCLCLGH